MCSHNTLQTLQSLEKVVVAVLMCLEGLGEMVWQVGERSFAGGLDVLVKEADVDTW